MQVFAVIGAGYGDEGKGLVTDYLCSLHHPAKSTVVVRANGGTQAAHTVQTPEGIRYIFHTHGSGTLLGVPTYMGPQFLLNPISFVQEQEALKAYNPVVMASPETLVQLPVDMMINQMMETLRGQAKHGSCGWGIGETAQRSLNVGLAVRLKDLEQLTLAKLTAIQDQYLVDRIASLGITPKQIPADWRARFEDEGISSRFLVDCANTYAQIKQVPVSQLWAHAEVLIFEGAQGLGLDQEGEHFPHVTRSYTGSTNMLEMLQLLDPGNQQGLVESIQVVYTTRAYATRHGAGPLENEGLPHGCTVNDPTNVPNKWQDSLRSAPLDVILTGSRIAADFIKVVAQYPQALISLCTTCIDQAGPNYQYRVDGKPIEANAKNDPVHASGRIIAHARLECLKNGVNTMGMEYFVSVGPTRAHVKNVGKVQDDFLKSLPGHLKRAIEKYGPK